MGIPKRWDINVGLYTSKPDVIISRKDLVAYATLRIGRWPPTQINGFHLGLGGRRPADEGVRTGDAGAGYFL